MEMNILDSFGPIDDTLAYLSIDEYAYLAGSRLVICPFKTEKQDKTYINSELSHFSKYTFNRLTEQLLTSEVTFDTVVHLKLFKYNKKKEEGSKEKEEGQKDDLLRDERSEREERLTLMSEYSLKNCSDVSYLELSRDGTRFLVVLPEPMNCMKIFDIVETNDLVQEQSEEDTGKQMRKVYVMKEILTVPIKNIKYKKCKFNPMNKNYIYMLSPKLNNLLEIIDAFPADYQIEQAIEINEEFQKMEESKIIKRYELYKLNGDNFAFEHTDFTWDRYGKIYLADSDGTLKYCDPVKEKNLMVNQPNFDSNTVIEVPCEEVGGLTANVTSLLLTQRYLLAAQSNGVMALVNMFMTDKEIKEFKNVLGTSTSYQKLVVEKTMSIQRLTNTEDYITSMEYDEGYKKILAKTYKNCLYVLFFKSELLVSRTDDKNESDDAKEIDNYEELKFHQGEIIGLRQLGKNTELISISKGDNKVIFWDYGKKECTSSHILEFNPVCFEVDENGILLFISSDQGVFRIYDISHRTSLRLIYQMKFAYKNSNKIDRIIVHPLLKYIVFYQTNDRYLYFLSGESSKKFCFLGFLKLPTKVIDVMINNVEGESSKSNPPTLASILVLVRGMLLLYNITKFHYDNNACEEIGEKKIDDVFTKFEIVAEPKAKKVDGDLTYILKNKSSSSLNSIWLIGKEKMFRIFGLPTDNLQVTKESKKPIETPEELKGHDLLITCGNIYNENLVISAGQDGYIQVRKDKKLIKNFRTHSFANGGISSFDYSPKFNLIFTSGYDGSIIILGMDDKVQLPESDSDVSVNSQIIEAYDAEKFLPDNLAHNFINIVNDKHQALIKNQKKEKQIDLKNKFEEIKNDQNKLFTENSKLEEHEQLKEKDMIIDLKRIDKEYKKNDELAKELTKERFRELCMKEMQKKVLFDSTYDKMRERDEDNIINNNIKMIYNCNGDRELKTYPLPTFSEKYQKNLTYIKQLRLQQKMEEYRRKAENQKEVIEEKAISCCSENYIINRFTAKPTIIEREVCIDGQGNVNADKANVNEEKSRLSVVKYRLQRNPYEETSKKGDDQGDQMMKGPEEQIYKDDQQMEFRTVIETKEPEELEFQKVEDIDTYSLLYTPFELYTNIRIRNQIYLLLDIIHQMKKDFNNEYLNYLKERGQILEKFNNNKMSIEAIKEILTDVPIQDYKCETNIHEDNAWIEKVEDSDIKDIPIYYSREENAKRERDRIAEEERLKALQGDTLQMRGLHHMIRKTVQKKKNEDEENKLVKQPWMNKKKEDMSTEELKLLSEFQKKEMELKEQKEKIRSQNFTKLNFHKSEIENNQIDLDMKFAKILRRKLHYDTIIAEQEIYILSLMSLLKKRESIKKDAKLSDIELKKIANQKQLIEDREKLFSDSLEKLENLAPKESNDKEKEKMLHFGKDESKNEETEKFLQKIICDPFYFYEKEQAEKRAKFGNKEWKEYPLNIVSKQNPKDQQRLEEEIKNANKKYYYDFKHRKFEEHARYLLNQKNKVKDSYNHVFEDHVKIQNKIENLDLNYSLMVRMKRGQDEVTDDYYINHPSHLSKILINEIKEEDNLDKSDEHSEVNDDSEKQSENEGEENNNKENIEEEPTEPESKIFNEENRYTLGIPVENSVLIGSYAVTDINKQLNEKYKDKLKSEKKNKDNVKEMENILLSNLKIEVKTRDTNLKSKFLRLTRVTKKIQEVVTGKEEINQEQIAKLYEDKKRNLEENTTKRIATLDKKLKEINNDIKKKMEENSSFGLKIEKLKEDIENTDQIIKFDSQNKNEEDEQKDGQVINKSEDIAEVSKLKNMVTNYYEEIEYLRAELDKLRARTFPSFLQKPDNVIYPDEK